MFKKSNRFISAFLALMMLCTLLPASAFAAGEPTIHIWTITFNANGGTGEMAPIEIQTESSSYIYNLPTCRFTAPEGQEFAYWTVGDSETPLYPDETIEVSSDITLKANWRAVTEYSYIVSFDANGGSGFMEPVFVTGTTSAIPYVIPACTYTPPEGMEFDYWIVEETGEDLDPGLLYQLTSSITLVAQWYDPNEVSFFG